MHHYSYMSEDFDKKFDIVGLVAKCSLKINCFIHVRPIIPNSVAAAEVEVLVRKTSGLKSSTVFLLHPAITHARDLMLR
jgi:hypothetical protein